MDLNTHYLDGKLLHWSEVEDLHYWSGLLLGNGASLVVWDKFKYDSLFKTACTSNTANPLTLKHLELFKKLGTENFEAVLDACSTAETVLDVIGPGGLSVRPFYTDIQIALFEAVHRVHPPATVISENNGVFSVIREVLGQYDTVFSTNYDLLSYWAIMSKEKGVGFKDYFWNDSGFFDPANITIRDNPTRVLYLHGGIHLARLANGRTLKRSCNWQDGTLGESLWLPREDGAIPLFITEGKSKDKEKAIGRSEYLTFGMDEFKKHKKPLVVFGHSLGESDNHLANAIRVWGDIPLAFSMRPDTASEIRQKKSYIRSRFPEAQLYFFESTSHPIGAVNLKIRTGPVSPLKLSTIFAASRRSPVDDSMAATG
jgi:Domain of unknown function (DUF4917)